MRESKSFPRRLQTADRPNARGVYHRCADTVCDGPAAKPQSADPRGCTKLRIREPESLLPLFQSLGRPNAKGVRHTLAFEFRRVLPYKSIDRKGKYGKIDVCRTPITQL